MAGVILLLGPWSRPALAASSPSKTAKAAASAPQAAATGLPDDDDDDETWLYEVTVAPSGDELTVTVDFGSESPGTLDVMPEGRPYVDQVEEQAATGFRAIKHGPKGWPVAPCPPAGCRIRYRYALGKAATKLDDPDLVARQGLLIISNPSTWVLHPEGGDEDQDVLVHAITKGPQAFSTGMFYSTEPGACVPEISDQKQAPPDQSCYATSADHLDSMPLTLIGNFTPHKLLQPDGVVEMVEGEMPKAPLQAEIEHWVERAATAVSSFYGRYPVPHVLVYVRPEEGHEGGVTFGYGGASIIVPLGGAAAPTHMEDDWVMTHEMVHLALPNLPREHHWLEEGIATYVEPMARARIGVLSRARVFRDLQVGLPNGLPERGDQGLDQTPTWGRTYWGGALYCFLVDVELRRISGGKIGIEAGLKGILAAGGSVAEDWTIDQVLGVADHATGYHVFRDYYDKMKAAPYPVDLDKMWVDLGVAVKGEHMNYDEKAPLAAVRRTLIGDAFPAAKPVPWDAPKPATKRR